MELWWRPLDGGVVEPSSVEEQWSFGGAPWVVELWSPLVWRCSVVVVAPPGW